ncbi:MAG: hypothetical protein ACI8S6_000262 [Myxococcota bacterium]
MAERRDQIIAVVLLAAVGVGTVLPWDDLGEVVRGRLTLGGDRAYHPAHPIQWQEVALEEVHQELLPRWSIAAARPGDPLDQQQEAWAWAALEEALVVDENLLELATALRSAIRKSAWTHHEEIAYLTWAWSHYLEQPGWRLEGRVQDHGDGTFVTMKTYRVVADTAVPLGDVEQRVRLLRRADHTSITERYLGHAGDGGGEGALLLADRIEVFALESLWPLMDPALDGQHTGPARAWAASVREEIGAALSDEQTAVLQGTAAARAGALRARQALRDRTDCSGGHVGEIPWQGVSVWFAARLRQAAVRDRDVPCPVVTEDEAEALAARFDAEGLEAALEALVAHAARATALHEAQHLADRAQPPRCEGADFCATVGLDADAVGELSAYLTSFASAEVGGTAFYQACLATHRGTGSHARAVAVAARALLPRGCVNPPPEALATQAQALRAEWRGERVPPRLATGFPQRVALSGY